MKILYTTDLHGNELLFQRCLEIARKEKPDVVLIGGDLAPKGPFGGITKNVQETIDTQRLFLEKLIHHFKIFNNTKIPLCCIMGNDDYRINEGILERAHQEGIIHYLHNKAFTINNYNIIGYPFVNITPFRLKDWEKYDNHGPRNPFILPLNRGFRTIESSDDATIKDDLQKLAIKKDMKKTIWLMHAPPFLTPLDMIHNHSHVGSKAIRAFIEEHQPLLTLHGHIHEAPQVSGEWKTTFETTTCINPGSNYMENQLRYVIITIDKTVSAELFVV
ncbi:metallophosphoesterase [Candidatus Woesearchaeota archaeon]|nr:metallophosphoesterase [Candidatus Woesearchaeota archaeon]